MRGNTNEQSQLFTATGTFTAPRDRTKVYVTACAGGGGGGGSSVTAFGGGGGAGDTIWRRNVAVTGGNNYTVTIGTGGTGGATGNPNGTAGATGGTTSFDVLFSLIGGSGGAGATGVVAGNGGAPGGPGGSCGSNGVFIASGGSPGISIFAPGVVPPSSGICFFAALLGLLILYLTGWHTEAHSLLLTPIFFGMPQTATYGSGGGGGSPGIAGDTGGGGFCLVEW